MAQSLAERIKAEFDAQGKRESAEKQAKAQAEKDREGRLTKFAALCEELKAVWRPRLEEFARQFGDKIKVTPKVDPASREARIDFMTDLANVTLKFTVAPDPEVKKVVLDYDLLIVPIFFDYERHSKFETPMDKPDRDAMGKWIDDRLVGCVKAYLSMRENEHYLKRANVEDPITLQRFPKEDAKAKFEHGGRMYYFASEQTLKEFKVRHSITDGDKKPAPAKQ